MNIREQAFKAIAGNPELWRQWNDARDEFDRSNMLIEQAYLLGVRQANLMGARQAEKVAAK